MRRIELDSDPGFRILAETDRAQAATMVLGPGQATGGPTNRHAESDQWLFVRSGTGVATVDGTDHRLEPGTLLLIEPGETHEIRADQGTALETLSLYSPPAY